VRTLLADEPVDLERAETSLGYPLRGRHVALALSLDRPSEHALLMLEREVRTLAGRAGATAQLTIPSGLTSVHGWLAPARAAWTLGAPEHDGVLVGIGTAAAGIEGFRRSPTQAKRALDVARLARPEPDGGVPCLCATRSISVRRLRRSSRVVDDILSDPTTAGTVDV
jgi:hypothetical protein